MSRLARAMASVEDKKPSKLHLVPATDFSKEEAIIKNAAKKLSERELYKIDPRLDLRQDSKYWARIIYNARMHDHNKSLAMVLHGIRCGGATLIMINPPPAGSDGKTKGQGSFKLQPGEWSQKEWEEIKLKWLAPVKDSLVEVLKVSRIGRYMDEGMVPPDVWKHFEKAGVVPVDGGAARGQAAGGEQGRLFGS